MMRNSILTLVFTFFFFLLQAQQIGRVSFSNASGLAYITIQTDQKTLLRISEDGRLLEYGTEEESTRYPGYFNPKLIPFAGRIDYYGPEADSASRGKVRSIGTCNITWYNHTEEKTRAGKLKTVGNLTLDYYNNFADKMQVGKLKQIGSNMIDFFTSFENEALRGKLKKVGNTDIKYYSSMDDKLIKGKVKSIGMFNYTWYTSFDRSEYRGSLKSGQIRQVVNGVLYILW